MSDWEGYFYKYRTINERQIDRSRRIFTHNELYFSSKNQFNDPFDCKFGYSFAAGKEETERYLRTLLERNRPHFNRNEKRQWIAEHRGKLQLHNPQFVKELEGRIEETISEIGICSLTRVPDDILMWSHYADSHRGFCIKLIDDGSERFTALAQAVIYSEHYPILNPIIDDDRTRFDKVLLTKAKHWKYEKEWRIIDHEKKPGTHQFPPHLLVGVIFGCRMSEDHQRQVLDWCANRDPRISFYQAREASGSYSLEIIRI